MALGKTKKQVFSLMTYLLCATFLLSCVEATNIRMGTEKPMMVTLRIAHLTEKAPVSVELEFTLKNDTADTLEVLTWGTPFEGEFNDNLFEVTQDGRTLPYLGRQFKRGAPQKEDFVEIAPYGELSTTILLEKAYAIEGPGFYTVQYRKPYLRVITKQVEEQLKPVESKRLEFKIGN